MDEKLFGVFGLAVNDYCTRSDTLSFQCFIQDARSSVFSNIPNPFLSVFLSSLACQFDERTKKCKLFTPLQNLYVQNAVNIRFKVITVTVIHASLISTEGHLFQRDDSVTFRVLPHVPPME